MRKYFLFAACLVASSCTSTFYSVEGSQVRLHAGTGGLASEIWKRYDQWQKQGYDLVIDGHVASMDAFVAFSYPGACYTENAVFSPHAASWFGLIPARDTTELLTQQLPKPLGEWFRGNVAYYDWIGYANVEFHQLMEIWPEGACPGAAERALPASDDPLETAEISR